MSVDTTKNTFWIYTGWSMFELVITKEDRDVWTLYLEKKQYDLALQYTKEKRQCFTIKYAMNLRGRQ
jgi:hypothetical protein